ncbi:MAG: autotransporter domain-containing protein [Alphaproteobacteria bacterium]
MFSQNKLLLGVSFLACALASHKAEAVADGIVFSNTNDADFSATFTSQTTSNNLNNATVVGNSLAQGLRIRDMSSNGNAGTATIADGVNIGGQVFVYDDNVHKLIFAGTSTLSGNVSGVADGYGLAKIEAGAENKTFSFTGGNLVATEIQLISSDGTISIDGTATGDSNVYGNINSTGGAAGDLTLKNTMINGTIGAGQAVGLIGVNGGFLSAVRFDGDINAEELQIQEADTIAIFSDGVDITGDINETGGALGILQFNGSSTVTGDIGNGGTVKIAGAANGKQVTFNGEVTADGLAYSGSGDFIFNDEATIANLNYGADTSARVIFNDDATITGNNTSSVAEMYVEGLNKTVTFEGDTLKVGDLIIENNAIFAINDDTSITSNSNGGIYQKGKLALDDNSLTLTGMGQGINVLDDSSISFTITDFTGAGTGGKLVLLDDIIVAAGKTITLIPTLSGVTAVDGDTYTLSTDQGISGGTVVVQDSGDVVWDISTVDQIVLTAIVRDLVSSGVNVRFAQATDNAPTDIKNKLKGAGVTDTERKVAGAQLAPEANNSTVEQTMAVSGQVGALIDARTSAVRSGIATGDALENVGAWGQFFGFAASQDMRGGVDGYDATAYGFAVGGDQEVSDGLILGLAFSYGRSDITGDGDTQYNGTDINSYGLNLYGSKNMGSWNLDGSLGYAYHDYSSNRVVNAVGISQNLEGSYGGNQYSASLGANMPKKVGEFVLTPWGKLDYSYLNQDSYSETGGTAALNVDSRKTDSLRTGLGVNINNKIESEMGTFTPELRLGWNHEFGDEKTDVTARYATGGAAFKTEGVSLPRDSATIGLGVDFVNKSNWTLSANYDAEIKEDYDSHTGRLQVRYDF